MELEKKYSLNEFIQDEYNGYIENCYHYDMYAKSDLIFLKLLEVGFTNKDPFDEVSSCPLSEYYEDKPFSVDLIVKVTENVSASFTVEELNNKNQLFMNLYGNKYRIKTQKYIGKIISKNFSLTDLIKDNFFYRSYLLFFGDKIKEYNNHKDCAISELKGALLSIGFDEYHLHELEFQCSHSVDTYLGDLIVSASFLYNDKYKLTFYLKNGKDLYIKCNDLEYKIECSTHISIFLSRCVFKKERKDNYRDKIEEYSSLQDNNET